MSTGIKRLFRFELKRALFSKAYIYSLVLGAIIAVWHFVECIVVHSEGKGVVFPLIQSFLGGDIQTSAPELYRLLVPLLACIPFAWSYYRDYQMGYLKTIYLYEKRSRFLTIRYVECAILGGICSIFPLVLSLFLSAPFYPNYSPMVFMWYGGPPAGSFCADFYYSNPMVYIIVYIGIVFVIGSLSSVIGLVIGLFARSRVQVLAFPIFVILYMDVICRQLTINEYSLIRMMNISAGLRIIPFLVMTGTSFLLTWVVFIMIGMKKDVLGDATGG